MLNKMGLHARQYDAKTVPVRLGGWGQVVTTPWLAYLSENQGLLELYRV